MEEITLTEEQKKTIRIMRIILGDTPNSVFYPVLTDEEYYLLLEKNNWNVDKATTDAGYSILFYFTQENYRERTGDIEVWNNVSIEYRKALEDFLNKKGSRYLPDVIKPYVAGRSTRDYREMLSDPDYLRSPLASIAKCASWYTRVKNYDVLIKDREDLAFSAWGGVWL